MTDIFKDLEEAAEQTEDQREINLGPITKLVERQNLLESPATEKTVDYLYKTALKSGASVNDLEEALKRLKKDLFQVKQVQIPELMTEFGLDSLTTTSGTTIEIKSDISLTVRDVEKLHNYIREKEAGDLIKDTIIMIVNSDEAREEVTSLLKDIDCDFERKEAVHSQTLKKFIRGCLEKGERPGDDALTIFEYKYSKIK